jgi:hypothetical protein
MTRNEFLETIDEWCELIGFCSDMGCDSCEDVIDRDGMNDEIENDLSEVINDYNWLEIRDALDGICTGYEYYRRNGLFDYEGMDDSDFQQYKDDALAWGDDRDEWDDEDDDVDVFTEELETSEIDDEEPVEDEDFSVGDLLGMCNVTLIEIQRNTLKEQKEDDMAFQSFVDANLPKILR